jgi:protein-disulfide isomerase
MHRAIGFKAFAFILLICGISSVLMAQESGADLKKEIEELKQGQQAIQKELMQIKSMLTKIAKPPSLPQINIKDVEFELGDNPVQGRDTAKFILIEFTDYQCPHCSRYVRDTYSQIEEQYVDKGVMRYAVIEQPLPIHPLARKAAEASHCADDQGKFWEMHKLMMFKQDTLPNLSSLALSLSLDAEKFEQCLNTEKYQDQVEKNSELALKLGINGVPGFIIASVDPQDPGKAKGISAVLGAMPYSIFKKELDRALNGQ